jgi:REP element-mobilizing transposase RayT
MSFVRIWVHLVWGTKKREPLLEKPQRYEIFNHIKENAKEKDIHLDHINGYADHVHCLVSLNADQTIAKVAQLLKGESSFWVNNKTDKLLPVKLDWCDDYYAVSVSESQVPAVRKYIQEQEEHHRKKTFAEECEEFMQKFGFTKMLE